MELVQEEIIQRLSRVMFVGAFMVVGLLSVASFYRTWGLGWHAVDGVHTALLLVYAGALLAEKKLNGTAKLLTVSASLVVFGLADFYFFSYYGLFYLGVGAVFLLVLLADKTKALAFALVNILGWTILGMALYFRFLSPTASENHWLLHGLALSWLMWSVGYTFFQYQNYLNTALRQTEASKNYYEQQYSRIDEAYAKLKSETVALNSEKQQLEHTLSALRQSLRKLQKDNAKAKTSDRLKTAFLDNLSHEIRTPVNGIVGFLQLFNETDSKEKIRYYEQVIQKSSSQLLLIVDDVLQMAQLETGQVAISETSYPLCKLLQEVYDIYHPIATEKGLDFSISGGQSSEEVLLLDRFKVKQVLKCLLTNAFTFTASGNVELGCRLEREQLIFWVKDTGIGISPEAQEKIFDYFNQPEANTTAQPTNAGVGLSISKGLVHLMVGKIWINSELGEGSTFGFSIPLKKKPMQRGKA